MVSNSKSSRIQDACGIRLPQVVKLIDDEEVRGWIEYYDKDIIRITRETQPNLFIYKNRVKYLYEDPAATLPSRT